MLSFKYISLATIDELFRYKHNGFRLDPFPGYTDDQWGIKAHNRPWIEDRGDFSEGQKIIEVGGAFSLLPKYLAEKYALEAWIGDDFGMSDESPLWSRWGNPLDLVNKHPEIHYVFKNFGKFLPDYPDQYFDRIFSVSTLEHIPEDQILDVLKDMHRCLRLNGLELHTIDIKIHSLRKILVHSAADKIPRLSSFVPFLGSEIRGWMNKFRESGVRLNIEPPNTAELLKRSILVESPDVIYRFYPPMNEPKNYRPAASLLVIIGNDG
jgi:hypothetical protein